MIVTPNLGNDWRSGAVKFLKYIVEDRGWRRPWVVRGNRFLCVGVIDRYTLEDNDNNRPAK